MTYWFVLTKKLFILPLYAADIFNLIWLKKFSIALFHSWLIDKEERCLLNCTIALSDPTYEDMEHRKIYNIDRLKIVFSQTMVFDQKKICFGFWRNYVNIKVNCGGKYPILTIILIILLFYSHLTNMHRNEERASKSFASSTDDKRSPVLITKINFSDIVKEFTNQFDLF